MYKIILFCRDFQDQHPQIPSCKLPDKEKRKGWSTLVGVGMWVLGGSSMGLS